MSNNKVNSGYEGGNQVLDKLAEGFGVVVIWLNGGLFSAYSDVYNTITDRGAENLRKNFAGAKTLYKDKAFLVKRAKGVLVWERAEGFGFGEKGHVSKANASLFPAYGS